MRWIFVEVVVEGQEVHVIWSNQEPCDLYEIGDDRPFYSPRHVTSALLEEHPEVSQEEMRRRMTSGMSSAHPGKEVMVVFHLFSTTMNHSHHWWPMMKHLMENWR